MKCPNCKTTELVKADVVLYDAYDCNTCGLEFDVDYLKLVEENKLLREALIEILNDAENYDGEHFDLYFESIAGKTKQALEQAK